MKRERLKSVAMLLTATFIWGTAFVAQIIGMNNVGPYTFCAARYALATLILFPSAILVDCYYAKKYFEKACLEKKWDEWERALRPGALCGLMLFCGSTIQQVALQYTTAGKASFITAFYIVLVPLFSLLTSNSPSKKTWIAILIGITGLYFISIKGELHMEFGDLLTFSSTIFWAGHLILCGGYSLRSTPLKMSAVQFSTAAVLSTASAFAFETPEFSRIWASIGAIFYVGFLSTCVAYTLQWAAQRTLSPTVTAMTISAESVFAAADRKSVV